MAATASAITDRQSILVRLDETESLLGLAEGRVDTGCVAFPIDTSHAFLRPSQLEALVRAVAAADEHEEHDWIEWKTDLDLATPEGRFHVVKQVLGFSNRTVAAAQRSAEGYSYIVVGAASGAIPGISTIDPADLTNGIGRYVGPVPWFPEWVTVDTRNVLVVIIEPPKPGDEAFTLKKGYGTHREGDIFVRTPGKSERATADQVAALFQRARASTPALDLIVRAATPTIEFGPTIDRRRLEQIIESERNLLMAPNRSTIRKSPATGMDAFNAFAGSGAMGALHKMTADQRSPEYYKKQVDGYLNQLRATAGGAAHHERIERSSAKLHLVVENLTLQNFKNVEVVVHLPGNVTGWSLRELRELEDAPAPPRRPQPLGTPRPFPNVTDNLVAQIARPSLPSFDPGPGFSADNTGSVTLTFDPVDLRPKSLEPLPAAPLIVHEPVGSELVFTWRATADNVDGLNEGDDRVIVVEGRTFMPRVSDHSSG